MARRQKAHRKTSGKPAKKWSMIDLQAAAGQPDAPAPSLPVPRKEVERVQRGKVRYYELARWIRNYTSENPDDANIDELLRIADRFEQVHEASLLLDEGNHESALTLFKKLLAAEPGDVQARLNIAQCYLALSRFEEARNELQQLDDEILHEPRAAVMNARASAGMGAQEEALNALRSSRKKHPRSFPVIKELVKLGDLIPVENDSRSLGKTRFVTRSEFLTAIPKEAQKAIDANDTAKAQRMAKYHLEAGMPDVAQAIAEVILKNEPDNIDAPLVLGTARSRLGDYVEALRLFQQVLDTDPDNTEAKVECAFCLSQQDEGKKSAREMLQSVLDEDPNHVRAAEIYVLLSESDEDQLLAIKSLREKYPDAWLPVKLQGDLDVRLGMFEQALQNHRTAFDLSNSDEAATMILHDLSMMDRYSEALSFVDALTDSLPRRNISVRWNCALMLVRLGKKRKAGQLLETIIRDRSLPAQTRFSANVLLHEVLPAG